MLARRGKYAVSEFKRDVRHRVAQMKSSEAVEYLMNCLEVVAGPMIGEAHPVDQWRVKLTPKERRIMIALHDARGAMVSHDGLMRAVYFDTTNDEPDEKIITVFVCKIRKKIPASIGQIVTHWGAGFSFLPAKDNQP
jgi:DNA-binding response OmpR family regulator